MLITGGLLLVSSAFSQTTEESREGKAQYRLEDLIALARSEGLALRSAKLQSEVSRAGVVTAQARPNPEIDWSHGSLSMIQPKHRGSASNGFTVSQRLDNPNLRASRIELAKLDVQAADLATSAIDNNTVAAIKVRYFELIKREEELSAAREELLLTEQIREKVAIRFRSGEGARFDLLRAETDVALAQKEIGRISARLAEARALLRQEVSPELPESYVIQKETFSTPRVSDLSALVSQVIRVNPAIRRSATNIERADQKVKVEQSSVYPSISVRIGQETQPDYRSTSLGISMSVPLFDRRRGPIAEARGLATRARTDEQLVKFELEQTVASAWHQYQAASDAVRALDGDILQRARTVVRIAEAAYRLGERGILEYLDARRQFRAVQAELISARLDLQLAITELERLAAIPLRSVEGKIK
jgi:outer membrane protein, heavy metal efflux system